MGFASNCRPWVKDENNCFDISMMGNPIAYIPGQQCFLHDVHHSSESMSTTHPSASAASAKLVFALMDNTPPARFQEDAATQENKAHMLLLQWELNGLLLEAPEGPKIIRTRVQIYLVDHQSRVQGKCLASVTEGQGWQGSGIPMEILIVVTSLLGVGDLHSLTKVSSLLREIAGPLFFAIRNFPTSTQDMFHLHIITFLENICASSCEELVCIGFSDYMCSLSVTRLTEIKAHPGSNHLKSFQASLRAFFSPELLPFTMQIIQSSPLEKLQLSCVDIDCAPSTLIQFLARHPDMSDLNVILRPDVSWTTARVTAPTILSIPRQTLGIKMDVDANNDDLVEMDDGGGKQMGDKNIGNANNGHAMDVNDTGGVANDGDCMDIDDARGEYMVARNLNNGILMDVDDTGGNVTMDARNINNYDIMDINDEYMVYMDLTRR
ncbi:hypothetical protein DEU56DRAFT_757687 [Suillus clintonianus]|uniref:uncharacterized protein n=1 Tax=Suillus clintonianus TaxID=1904413 RepID=UPI001B86C634|nr:uncharacterized protein DEU56DRAFT_757687 [Suillus clintonianus]KAG2131061.1 hypothetical protein DEU56DRAFT_757687 [Suillus clintonianus]